MSTTTTVTTRALDHNVVKPITRALEGGTTLYLHEGTRIYKWEGYTELLGYTIPCERQGSVATKPNRVCEIARDICAFKQTKNAE